MKALRVEVTAWTASFRYGGFMIGIQPTLPMPPLSTLYGLLSAAAGRPMTPHDTFLAYTFRSEGSTVDLERIMEVEPGVGGKWNVINREWVYQPHLTLYVNPKMRPHFEKPYFPLLLGRSSDLASIHSIKEVELQEVSSRESSTFGHSIYTHPPAGYRRTTMYALPVYFTDDIPRVAVGTRPFMMVTEAYEGHGEGVRDPDVGLTMELFTAESLGLGNPSQNN